MLNQGTLRLSLTFNPLHARQKAASGELPTDSLQLRLYRGTLGNVHFVTIPANAPRCRWRQSSGQFPALP
ncbi:ABC transporter, periplasmic substrate-binding protein YnjB [Klebsiella pneumoniae]|uniref:ABC transporter, periplasmic substrate-binding protein YnjB n=1 Tax=Klebsiella pneumoniae TaxID=573 RepID=A0A2X3HH89_KLEPN|nr:ABC transporter, periplasmic substrate-binding protein YnjB [Klebsiella pneumoniae]